MTREEKYDLVSYCETPEGLALIILSFAEDGIIQGKTKNFIAKEMVKGLRGFINGTYPPNVLTREFGIRQQAMYLKYYLVADEDYKERMNRMMKKMWLEGDDNETYTKNRTSPFRSHNEKSDKEGKSNI